MAQHVCDLCQHWVASAPRFGPDWSMLAQVAPIPADFGQDVFWGGFLASVASRQAQRSFRVPQGSPDMFREGSPSGPTLEGPQYRVGPTSSTQGLTASWSPSLAAPPFRVGVRTGWRLGGGGSTTSARLGHGRMSRSNLRPLFRQLPFEPHWPHLGAFFEMRRISASKAAARSAWHHPKFS